ncbi:MAG: helix-turn-helix transcriptional regulator [Ruminococcaceae bacterium]|nr:helix-turn-helix transcriptional regulator [Oscillospiraceae bacterium]
MDQIKIGRFISECRKKEKLTQVQLAEMLGITDKAVSKWERGVAMPDSSIMLRLCDILKINVNDLLCGEVVTMDNYNKELEKNLLEMVRQKEAADKRLLKLEIVMGVIAILPLVAAAIISCIVPMEEWKSALLVGLSLIPLLIATPFALKIEQKAGYYECKKCGHRHIPGYGSVFFAMHVNRTRYMRCPKCGKASWQKKVISKDK